MKSEIIENCKKILSAYKIGLLGQTVMPEDSKPDFKDSDIELRISYFTLPMSLNYQRDSYKLWEAVLKTFNNPETRFVFDVKKVTDSSEQKVREALMKYKVALQPNKHINSWRVISKTIYENWGSFENFFKTIDGDFLKLKQMIQVDHKKGFPYLSGPKIFNYWSFVMSTYGKIKLSHRDHIDIAPDTHITQCSIKLGIITQKESGTMSKDAISQKWRKVLCGSGIDPIDMHSPLWFWSRNGFLFDL